MGQGDRSESVRNKMTLDRETRKYFVGIDSGGTFTDCTIVSDDGTVTTSKSSSTPADPSVGIINSMRTAAASLDLTVYELLSDVEAFSHGSTVALNTLLQRRGEPTGLITTKGFEDTLLIGRIHQKVAGLTEQEITQAVELRKPRPLIPKTLTRGINERMDSRGRIVVTAQRAEVEEAVRALLDQGVTSIAVCLLWSFANPAHEQLVREVIQELAPECYVSLSSKLAPMIGEYERMATTALNSYLGPTVSRYLVQLQTELSEKGLGTSPQVMQSVGGVLGIDEISQRPVNTLLSGPVGGVVASRVYAERTDIDNIICTDVGGTSFDVALLVDGAPQRTHPIIGQYHTLVPMIDIQSVGTGGGSVARVEPETKTLHVGPESAGAEPGPACYGRGGTVPTVTDAAVVLGYMGDFLGGTLRLDREAALATVQHHIAEPLGMSVLDAALGILTISNAQMADLIRKVTIERGHDPREFVMFAYGGAGPQHAWWYALESGVRTVVVPELASVFSAYGLVASDWLSHRTISEPRDFPVDHDFLNSTFSALEQEVLAELAKHGTSKEILQLERHVEMRYRRQVNEVPVKAPLGILDGKAVEQLGERFEADYEALYGKGSAYKQAGKETVTYSVTGRAERNITPRPTESKATDANRAVIGQREVVFPKPTYSIVADLYRLEMLKPGMHLSGPAILEGGMTSIVVPPGAEVSIDPYLNVILDLSGVDFE